jgi:hypothetical protein
MKHAIILVATILCTMFGLQAQTDTVKKTLPAAGKKDHWYDKLSIRGYSQFRYNRLGETNPDLKFDNDKSVGDTGGFLFRRARIILSGDVHPHVFLYFQIDMASSPSSTALHYGQIRDLYADIYIDTGKVYRFRVGQSKVPFGYENMQSSQNRLPIDRSEALNTAVPSERDMCALFYWTPKVAQQRFEFMSKNGLKHSNNYGVFGFGVYNGQALGKPEMNNNMHVVSRITWPFQFGKQIVEIGMQGYTGFYTLESSQISSGVKTNATKTYNDKRAAATIALAPQPFGLLAEYNIGESPMYLLENDSIASTQLKGGFVTLCYMWKLENKMKSVITPFARAQYYSGGFKSATDTKSLKLNEYEGGVEFQLNKNLELTACYVYSIRNTSAKNAEFNNQDGRLIRLQLQVNY